ncbi:MAG TPA: ATP-binding protein [Tepidisphaeraceae bacterium]|nr:ATP-binding protein [Tepidisphaeraceae bacterium]
MTPLIWGLLAGWLGSLIVSACAGYVVYRRYERLQQRARHAERLAELGTLTGGLAHEIKNPLSTVQLNLQLLGEDLDPNNPAYPRLQSRLNTVQKETSRLRDILDDFLRYAGRMELVKKPVELNGMLEELVDFFSPQAQIQRVHLRLNRADGQLIAAADERLLKQAILNLLINGLQAMPEAGGEMILSARRQDGQAVLDVIDTGRGMDQETVNRIFDAYFSTKRAGTGLGLAISRRIVQEHGGQIRVTSEPGKGSDFTVTLPSADNA